MRSDLIVMVRSRSDVQAMLTAMENHEARVIDFTVPDEDDYAERDEIADIIKYLKNRIQQYDDAVARGEVEDDDKIPF